MTDENKIKPVGFVAGRFSSSMVIHREFKVFGKYAYSVCDEGNSSLQIIDLSYLPDSVSKVADIQDEYFGRMHNITIDTVNGLLYACIVTPIVNGILQSEISMRVYSLYNPIEPMMTWEGPLDIAEVHDCYVRNNIAILNCGQDGLRVYDFTNPTNPIYLNNLTFYQDQGYNHQGWLSPDGKTYVFADETEGKRVKKCSVGSDWSIQVEQLFGTNYENNSVPHNMMCTNEFAFVAYYNEGLRIFDIRNKPVEIAAYDTYTEDSPFKMNGAWGVYSNYSSGRIIVSDRQNGLFLFDFDKSIFLNPAQSDFTIYPNPIDMGNEFIIRSSEDEISNFKVSIYDLKGQLVGSEEISNYTYSRISAPLSPGIYKLKIEYVDYLDNNQIEIVKLITY